MKPLRAIFSLLLVAIATVLVGCGGPAAKAPPTYTPEKIANIQLYLTPVKEARDRMGELGRYVSEEDWNNVKSIIHGPFGGLRASTSYINQVLLKKDQPRANQLADTFYADLVRLDAAAGDNIPSFANEAFKDAVGDFDAYLRFIPTEPDSAT